MMSRERRYNWGTFGIAAVTICLLVLTAWAQRH